MKNLLLPIAAIGFIMVIVGLFMKNAEQREGYANELRNATNRAYGAGFSRAANTLHDEKGCALESVPNIDSLYRLDFLPTIEND